MKIIWKWKSEVLSFKGKPGVVGVGTTAPFVNPSDDSMQGRGGWVGFVEGDEVGAKTEAAVLEAKRKLWEAEDRSAKLNRKPTKWESFRPTPEKEAIDGPTKDTP